MDDFGTGYSSPELSAQLPVRQDQDRPVVRRGTRRRPRPARRSSAPIAGLGQSLGMATMAEGVETEEQLAARAPPTAAPRCRAICSAARCRPSGSPISWRSTPRRSSPRRKQRLRSRMTKLYRLIYFSKNKISGGPTADRGRGAIDPGAAAAQQSASRPHRRADLQRRHFRPGAGRPVQQRRGDVRENPAGQRHGDVQVLAFDHVERAVFAKWSMGYFGQSREGQDLFGHIAKDTGFNIENRRRSGCSRSFATPALDEEARAA